MAHGERVFYDTDECGGLVVAGFWASLCWSAENEGSVGWAGLRDGVADEMGDMCYIKGLECHSARQTLEVGSIAFVWD